MTSMLYDTDIHAWAIQQAQALRDAGRRELSNVIDWENVAEEIESLGREQVHALRSALTRILEHMLKLGYSPALEPRRHWMHEASLYRIAFERRLEDNPGLRSRLNALFTDAYADARKYAAVGLRRDFSVLPDFPEEPPFTLAQIRDPEWFPDAPGKL